VFGAGVAAVQFNVAVVEVIFVVEKLDGGLQDDVLAHVIERILDVF
jgi:hypothetical protein